MTTGIDRATMLAREQSRVARLVDSMDDATWAMGQLDPVERGELERTGHFEEYAPELAFVPREVAGHLRDSATIFADRIDAIINQVGPPLADFVTDDPQRLSRYADTPRASLLSDLALAQERLRTTVAGVAEGHLTRTGIHETDGPVSLAWILDFLPQHQADHAEQLERLAVAGDSAVAPSPPRVVE